MTITTKHLPITVRPATGDDIETILALELGYQSDYVWQMDFSENERQKNISFREVRLPRPIRVSPPRSKQRLADNWQQRDLFIVAEREAQVVGFLAIDSTTLDKVGRVADFGVHAALRQHGIGTALLASAMAWCQQVSIQRLIIETQSKNHPAIAFCRKHGFVFCGYNDRYYPNQDIAIFFGRTLR